MQKLLELKQWKWKKNYINVGKEFLISLFVDDKSAQFLDATLEDLLFFFEKLDLSFPKTQYVEEM